MTIGISTPKKSTLATSISQQLIGILEMSQTFFVKNLTGGSVQIKYDPAMTVRQVKEQLAAEQQVPPESIRLVYGGKELVDTNKVSDYNVGPGSNVNMVLRLQGGRKKMPL
jgi:hypothetical protein